MRPFAALIFAFALFAVAPAAHAESLTVGASGSRVSELQRLLSATGYYSYEITGYFGQITLGALQRFQCERMGICTGSPESTGYGAYGPRTYAALSGFSGPPTPPGITPPGGTAALIAALLEQVRVLQAQIDAIIAQQRGGQYSWQVSGWGSCNYGMQARTVSCVGSTGSVFPDTACSALKPPTQQSCIAPGDNSSLCAIGSSRIGECTLY